jgi:hypothetical protein
LGAFKGGGLAAAAIFMAALPALAEDVTTDSLWTKSRLLDGGWRNDLADHGISFDGWWTQFYQGSKAPIPGNMAARVICS